MCWELYWVQAERAAKGHAAWPPWDHSWKNRWVNNDNTQCDGRHGRRTPKVLREEDQFSLHCPGPVLWKHRGRVTNPTGTGGLSPEGIQTGKGYLYLQVWTWVSLLRPWVSGSGVVSTKQESTLTPKWTWSGPPYQAQGFPGPPIHSVPSKKQKEVRPSWRDFGEGMVYTTRLNPDTNGIKEEQVVASSFFHTPSEACLLSKAGGQQK